MGLTAKTLCLISVVLALLPCGCGEKPAVKPATTGNYLLNSGYSPTKIKITGLTEYKKQEEKIKAYVVLTDQFNSQIKYPGEFRFELYERILRSTEPKGKRIAIWDDIALKDAALNNSYWRDFLRAYLFSLPFKSVNEKEYILEITFMGTDGERLTDDYTLKIDQ